MHVVNYTAFRDDFHVKEDESEIHLLEKFHAARSLSQDGDVDTFIDPVLYDPERHSHRVTADLAGIEEDNVTAVFCETQPPGEALMKDLEMIDEAENSKAVVVYPFKVESGAIDVKFRNSVNSGKFMIEHLNWSDKSIERAFRSIGTNGSPVQRDACKDAASLVGATAGEEVFQRRDKSKTNLRECPPSKNS